MTTTNADTATLTALARTPLAKRALEEADREQHDRRRAALARLTQAEAARREAIAEAVKPIPALREAHRLARQRLRDAALELHRAECDANDTESASDARCAAARRELVDLGGAELEAARIAFAIEQRIAQAQDEYRTITEPHPMGGAVSRTIHIDRGGNDKLRRISGALAELDAMTRDPELSPAAIARRCDELRAAVESGARIARPSAEVTFEGNDARKPPGAIVQRIVRKYLRR